MIRGLTTAASGMLAEERLQQILTNNLANIETPGFKATDGELLSFPQQLLERMDYGSNSGPVIGKMGTGVTLQEGVPLFVQGALQAANNGLDVAIVDGTAPGPYAMVSGAGAPGPTSVRGQVVTGPNGRLEIGGQPLAVVDSNGNVIPGIYAAANPNYQGAGMLAGDGSPSYDSAGQPSYQYVNAQNVKVGAPGQPGWTDAALRVGTDEDMGNHSFFAVAYQSPYATGMALTRDGQFTLNANHEVVDASGNAVLPVDRAGKPIITGRIRINTAYQGSDVFQTDGSPIVGKNGQPSYTVVDVNGNPIPGAKFGIVDADVTKLTPLGQSEFQVGGSLNATQVLAQLKPASGQLKPGQTEQSTVDTTATMTKMTALMSLYQANANVLQTENIMLGQAVSDVGKVNG